jgi:hypothetical protein
MKREILCPDCGADSRHTFPMAEPYPGEFVKFVDGTAINHYICDQCGRKVPRNSDCVAFTIYTKTRPYEAWEFQYIKIKEGD